MFGASGRSPSSGRNMRSRMYQTAPEVLARSLVYGTVDTAVMRASRRENQLSSTQRYVMSPNVTSPTYNQVTHTREMPF